MINKDELLRLNAQGWIPGPGESEKEFLARVQAGVDFFNKQKGKIPPQHWMWSEEQLQFLYGFSPKWCVASLSSKGLAFWQAAATWIDVKRIYFIRIRPSRWVSFFVDRNELLSHEAIHAARAAFQEKKYEEFFAYQSSSSKWRRIFGPLFRTPVEATILVCLLLGGAVVQWIELIAGKELFSAIWFWVASLFTLTLFIRLLYMKRHIEKASNYLLSVLGDRSIVRSILFRLTDREIDQLAKNQTIQPKNELRWQLIQEAYVPIPKNATRSHLGEQ